MSNDDARRKHHQIPIRHDMYATIIIPPDLRPSEAERLIGWLRAMAVPQQESFDTKCSGNIMQFSGIGTGAQDG